MIAFVLGTRPEIIKLSPVIRACQETDTPFRLIHTGQHYGREVDAAFFEELDLPRADVALEVGSAPHGEQTGRMLIALEREMLANRPRCVVVQGDTNSVLAGALAAAKLHVPVAHVEAGLRSYDRRMPEELNRVVADHLSSYLFCPTEKAQRIALGEGIPREKVHLVGNTIVDAVRRMETCGGATAGILERFGVAEGEFMFLTAHRPENVDHKERFAALAESVAAVAERYHVAVLFPVHPRTRVRIARFEIDFGERVILAEPVGFRESIFLQRKSLLVLTDSGGIQEEACILRAPCVTLRDNTERPETVEVGANVLAGVERGRVMDAAERMIAALRNWPCPFGDGRSGERILAALNAEGTDNRQ